MERSGLLEPRAAQAASPILILYYNTLWNAPFDSSITIPDGFEATNDRRRYMEANAVLFHLPQWRWQPRAFFPPKLPGQLWVGWSMESAENYPRLKDPAFMRRFDLTMTYRLDSDVPVPYFSFYSSAQNLANALRRPPEPKTDAAPLAMFISSRIDRSGRRAYARELMRYLKIDSYGKFLNNMRLPDDHGRSSKMERLKRYKFTLAFENAIDRDYVTEKFYDPLVAGSVPIYLGAPNVATFAPGEHSYINVQDFPNPKTLAGYVQSLLHDQAAYNEYFAWKTKPYLAAFEALIASQAVATRAMLCYAVQARLTATR